MRDSLSLVISAFNEEGNVVELHRRLREATAPLGLASLEYIFVDDGSTDATLDRCLELQKSDPAVKIVRLLRNFGHEAAMTAGMDHARGEAVVFIDADLQHPPELVGRMVGLWRRGHGLVLTRRTTNAEASPSYRLCAGVFYRLLNALSDRTVPANMPDFRLLDRKYVNILKSFDERDSLFRGLLAWGVSVDRVPVIEFSAPERLSGRSKYGFLKSLRLAVDGIVQFSVKPLYLSLLLAALTLFFAVVLGIDVVVERYILRNPTPGFATIVVTTLIMGGMNLLMLSIMGFYIAKIHMETKKRPIYLADFLTAENTDGEGDGGAVSRPPDRGGVHA